MIRREDVEDLIPLTPMQEGMLFHGVLDPGSRAYHVQVVHRLRGALDPGLLSSAWEGLAEAHPILRTVFTHEKARRPLQVVLRRPRTSIRIRDLRGHAEPSARAAIEEEVRQDLRRGFDLAEVPPWRVTLFRLAPELHEVLWSFHHILLDGWSTGLLLGDLAAIYRSLQEGRGPSPPTRPAFGRYLTWLEGRDRQPSLAYWQERLDGLAGASALPPDRPPRPEREYQDGEVAFELEPELRRRLAQVVASSGVTENNLLQAAWGVLLAQHSYLDDVAFGSIGSGRPPELEGAEEMVGLFVNVSPVRIRIDPRQPFDALARGVQARWLEAQEHLYVPLADIGAAAAVSHVFAYESYPIEGPTEDGEGALHIEEVRTSERTHYPFGVVVTPGETLRVKFFFDRGVYQPETVEVLAESFRSLLGAITEDPGRAVGELDLVSPARRRLLLDEWCRAPSDYPRGSSIPELFAETCAARPGAWAVTDAARSFSYAEIAEYASRMAAHLRGRGLAPEELVGVCMGRSAEMVAALLGVVEAGGAYLGLDPSWPEARIEGVLEDAGVRFVLTPFGAQDRSAFTGREVLGLKLPGSWPLPREEVRPVRGISPDALAYVSYTSGTTGEPKGVCVPHRGVVRLVRDSWYLDVAPEDVVLFAATLSFDASTLELFGALLNGARLVIAPEDASLLDIERLVHTEGVSVLWLTAGLFHALVEERPEAFRGPRVVLAGGEALAPERVRRALEAGEGLTLVNGYGPTENTTFSSCHRMDRSEEVEDRVPIGRPVSASRAYVLGAELQLLPPGAAGELYVAGDGLARGYLGRPALTADRFLPDPFAEEPGQRLYRTGDLVRWRADGTLDFLGRRDDQVKIRGFRVEPAEAEVALGRITGGGEVAVMVDRTGDEPRLIAYVVPPRGSGVREEGPERLLERLREELPAHLVPGALVFLEALPLRPSGKVDRTRLATLAAAPRPPENGEHSPARTETERAVAAVFAEVLGVQEVGRGDDFFRLGGHSLKALQVLSRIHRKLGRQLSLRRLFEAPTVADLSAAIEGLGTTPELDPIPVPTRRDRSRYRVAARADREEA